MLGTRPIRVENGNRRCCGVPTGDNGNSLFCTRALNDVVRIVFRVSPTGDNVEIFTALTFYFRRCEFSQADGQWPPLRVEILIGSVIQAMAKYRKPPQDITGLSQYRNALS